MKFRKYLRYALQRRIKFGIGGWKFAKPLSLLHFLIPAAAVLIPTAIVLTQVPNLRLAAFRTTKPKPIIASAIQLPSNVQQTIENLASQEIKAEQANTNLAVSGAILSSQETSIIQPLLYQLQETLASNPANKAKITLRKIDRQIGKLQNLLINDKSDKAVDQAVSLIQTIGQQTDKVATDPSVVTDRQVLGLVIEQYNRLQLTLQELEDTLPIEAYLKIEDARQKYLVVTATNSINAAPNLDAVHNIALKEVAKVVGNDYSELKAIEIISDFEAGVKPEARQKLTGLEKQLAVEFEKKMLKLPQDVRERKLQNFISYSFGDPIKQIRAFNQMRDFLSNQKLVSEVDSLKEIALKKLDKRIVELNSIPDKDQSALNFFNQIKSEEASKTADLFDVSTKASAQALADHLTSINDPEIFEKYQNFLSNNPKVQQTLQKYLGQSFLSALAKRKQLLEKRAKDNQQTLFEKVQQITQQIFTTADNATSSEEKKLPEAVQLEVETLKDTLPDQNIPALDVPEGITLPEVAKLPDDVAKAIVTAAQNQIDQQNTSAEAKLDLEVQAKDLGVSEPTILPDNPLYPVINVISEIPILLTADPVQKAEELLKIDNEKTLEAAKLVEESQSQQTIDLALETLNSVAQDFDKLKEHADELKTLEQTQPEKVDQLVDQIIDNGLARQTVLASIEDKVTGDEYVKVEQIRAGILKDGVDTLLQLTDNNVQSLTDKLETAVQQASGSDLKDIKAVELLTEIAKTQPEEVAQIIEKSEQQIVQNLETKLLEMPAQKRVEKVLDYVASEPGNPVIQFEAADVLKDNFTNPETIALAEGIKDKAVENLTQLVSEITDGAAKQEFVDQVVGDKPQDLAVVIDMEARVAPPETAVVTETLPIVAQIEDIKAAVEQNIIESYIDKPQELTQTTDKIVDIVEVKAAQELTDALERSPEIEPAVVKAAQDLEQKTINQFIEEISPQASASAQVSVSTEAAKALTPIPEVVAELIALKDETLPSVDAKIDTAIKVQVDLMEQHLVSEVNDPQTFETYVAQIEQDPVVAKTVAEVGGSQFAQAIEQKTQEIQAVADKEQATLETTVTQIQQEIFSTSQPSAIEQTLPQTIQEEIQQIKQEIPPEQIPAVTVSATVEVAPQPTAPPAAPEVQQPPAPVEPAPAIVEPPPVAPAPAVGL